MRGWPAAGTGMGPGIRVALVGLAVTGWAGLLFYQVLSRLAIYMPVGGLAGGVFHLLTAAGELAQGLAFYLCLLVLLLLFLEERNGWRWPAGATALTRPILWALIAALVTLSLYGGLRPFGLPLLVAYNALGLAVMVLFSRAQIRPVGEEPRAGTGQEAGLPAASSWKVAQLVSGFNPQPPGPGLPWPGSRWPRRIGMVFAMAWALAFLSGILHSSSQLWGWPPPWAAGTSWAAGQVVVLAGGLLLLPAAVRAATPPGARRWLATTVTLTVLFLFAWVYQANPYLVAILVNWTLGLSLHLPLPIYLLSLAGFLYALLALSLSSTRRRDALVLTLLPVAGYSLPLAFNTLVAVICLFLIYPYRPLSSATPSRKGSRKWTTRPTFIPWGQQTSNPVGNGKIWMAHKPR
ncbi:MAG: hypothetical protein D9V47_08130 [Clostridia bacterium]|nr:MAG: hypothetical protein D9V47_08130 [Clostridia bacterium]